MTDPPFGVRVTFTIPGGWSINDYTAGRASLLKRAGDRNTAFATAYLVTAVYSDPCAGGIPEAGRLAADAETLVNALRSQPGFDLGDVSVGSLDGYPAWTWQVTPSLDVSACASDPWLYQWQSPGDADGAAVDYGTIAGATQRITVVDFDGTPVLFEVGTFESTPDADRAEAHEVIDTATFD